MKSKWALDLVVPVIERCHRTDYKDALKYGFYEFQTARDWYREVTSDVGMHAELVMYWIRSAALVASPIAPHFAEHIWTSESILKSRGSIQLALWPSPGPVDRTVVESGVYMRDTMKAIRDAEFSLSKKMNKNKEKGKGNVFDPKKRKSVRVYVATAF